MEHKLLQITDVELKFATGGTFAGYASVFGGVDLVGDMILPGAYADTLKTRHRPVRMYYNHAPTWPIGKWTKVAEDGRGLYVEGELTPRHSIATDVKAAMQDTNVTNNIVLDANGKIRCLSCHGIHYTDSNSLTEDNP